MRAILAASVALGLCGLGAAADDKKAAEDKKADPVGTWKCSYEIGDQKRESTLKVQKDGDKFTGTMSWADQKEAKLKDVAFKGGELKFSADRELMDMKFTIKYTFKIEGDTAKGKGEVDFGGETRAFDIEGKREKAK